MLDSALQLVSLQEFNMSGNENISSIDCGPILK
jgi:hypothetical protein